LADLAQKKLALALVDYQSICHIDNMTSKQFAELRSGNGYSQERLAKAMRVSARTVARWEAASRVPKLAELALLYLVDQRRKEKR